jgi:hypothetical protein
MNTVIKYLDDLAKSIQSTLSIDDQNTYDTLTKYYNAYKNKFIIQKSLLNKNRLINYINNKQWYKNSRNKIYLSQIINSIQNIKIEEKKSNIIIFDLDIEFKSYKLITHLYLNIDNNIIFTYSYVNKLCNKIHNKTNNKTSDKKAYLMYYLSSALIKDIENFSIPEIDLIYEIIGLDKTHISEPEIISLFGEIIMFNDTTHMVATLPISPYRKSTFISFIDTYENSINDNRNNNRNDNQPIEI